MIKYNKEEPSHYPDFGQLMTPPVPMTEEHWLANIISAAHEIIADDSTTCKMQNVAVDIQRYARKLWDLIPLSVDEEWELLSEKLNNEK